MDTPTKLLQLQADIYRIQSERDTVIQERDKYRKESAAHRDEIAKLTARLTAETSALRNELDDVNCQLADAKRKLGQVPSRMHPAALSIPLEQASRDNGFIEIDSDSDPQIPAVARNSKPQNITSDSDVELLDSPPNTRENGEKEIQIPTTAIKKGRDLSQRNRAQRDVQTVRQGRLPSQSHSVVRPNLGPLRTMLASASRSTSKSSVTTDPPTSPSRSDDHSLSTSTNAKNSNPDSLSKSNPGPPVMTSSNSTSDPSSSRPPPKRSKVSHERSSLVVLTVGPTNLEQSFSPLLLLHSKQPLPPLSPQLVPATCAATGDVACRYGRSNQAELEGIETHPRHGGQPEHASTTDAGDNMICNPPSSHSNIELPKATVRKTRSQWSAKQGMRVPLLSANGDQIELDEEDDDDEEDYY